MTVSSQNATKCLTGPVTTQLTAHISCHYTQSVLRSCCSHFVMTPLHQWLGLYLDRTEARDWRDGHLYTEALNQMASHWFSRIK